MLARVYERVRYFTGQSFYNNLFNCGINRIASWAHSAKKLAASGMSRTAPPRQPRAQAMT
jgi:hypothetical protein